MEVKSRVGCQDARLRSGSERSPRRPSSCTRRTHTNVPIERITLAPTVARNLRKRSSAQQFPAVAEKDEAGGSSPRRPLPALTSEMLVIVSGVSLDGGVPDQELLPGYRSWSWMCCSRSPHRPVEAPHRPVECHPRSENGPSGPSTTCLVGLTRPTLAAPLTTGRSRPPRRRRRRPLRLGVSRPGRARQALQPGSTVGARCGSGWAVPAGLVGWSEPGKQARR